jgi:hypothetical protein
VGRPYYLRPARRCVTLSRNLQDDLSKDLTGSKPPVGLRDLLERKDPIHDREETPRRHEGKHRCQLMRTAHGRPQDREALEEYGPEIGFHFEPGRGAARDVATALDKTAKRPLERIGPHVVDDDVDPPPPALPPERISRHFPPS